MTKPMDCNRIREIEMALWNVSTRTSLAYGRLLSLEHALVATAVAIFLIAGSSCLINSSGPKGSQPSEKDDRSSVRAATWPEKTASRLTLEEKVGQLLQVRYYADYVDSHDPELIHLRKQIRQYRIGSIALYVHRNELGPIRAKSSDVARLTNLLQEETDIPLLVAADLERGIASRLSDVASYPWPMAFGATGDRKDVEKFGLITARQARAVGINWVFAPVADVNDNPANPVINTRSYGEDPQHVAELVAAFIRGGHEHGLLLTAKHFPGSGNTITDPHLQIASLASDMAHLNRVELVPFVSAIQNSVDAIMIAHERVPAIEPDLSKIATTSEKIVTGTLKKQLGFNGLVVTDALEMEGLTKLYDPRQGSPTARAAIDAINAGCDLITIPTDIDAAFHAIVNAVRSGTIPESRINDSVLKVLRVKASIGLDKERLVNLDAVDSIEHDVELTEFAQHIADASVTLVRDNKIVLPIRRSDNFLNSVLPKKVAHRLVALMIDEAFTNTDGKEFEKALKSRRPDAEVFYFDNRTDESVGIAALAAVKDADQVVLAVYASHNGVRHISAGGKILSSFGPLGSSGKVLEKALASGPRSTVVIALGNPYLILNFPEIETYICTYSQTSTSEISAVKSLFGEIENRATLPITLPGIANRGFSIPWPAVNRPVSH